MLSDVLIMVIYFSIIIINMRYMITNLFNYIMFRLVMVVSRNIVIYITCMFYVLCKITIDIKIIKFLYFSYSDTIISVYGIMFINNNTINKIIIRLFIFETLLILYL